MHSYSGIVLAYLLVVEHKNLRGRSKGQRGVRRGRTLANINAHRLQQRRQEKGEVFRGRVCRSHQHLIKKNGFVEFFQKEKGIVLKADTYLVVRTNHEVLVQQRAESDCW